MIEKGRRTDSAPFLIAEVLEIVSENYPVKMKVWYYETYQRRGLIYGNGRFMRMNYNDSTDTGVETEKSVVCKFKKLNKGGKIPKNVKDVISRNDELNHSFQATNERKDSESESELESYEFSSEENEEITEERDDSENEEKERELEERLESTILNENINENVTTERRKRKTQNQKNKLPKGWAYVTETEEKKVEEEINVRRSKYGRRI